MAPKKSTEALSLAKKTLEIARKYKKSIKIVSCIPSIHIPFISKTIKNTLYIGGQSVSASTEEAQTGLISAEMLASYGTSHCIVGHSESRERGETDEQVLSSTLLLLQKKITPIICIGEKQRDAQGWYLSTVKSQIESIVLGIPKAQLKKIVFAYEPIWAIGKNAAREATPVECREMLIFIRKVISDIVDIKTANTISILYGGSVNEQNGTSFILEGGANGLLVGRISLDAKRFEQLAKTLSLVS